MSSKLKSVLGAVVVGLAFLAGATQGCGSSGGTANVADLCMRGCDKAATCFGVDVSATCKSSCSSMGTGANGARCTNEAAMVAKFNECLAVACDKYLECAGMIPKCQSATTGTAGTGATGAGGTTGTAGTSATGTAGTSSTGAAGFTFDGGGFDLGGLTGSGGSAGSTCATACVKADACCKALPGANPADCMFVKQCNDASNPATAVQGCNTVLQAAAYLGANAPAACK